MELSIPLTLKNIDIDWSNLNWKQITSYAAVIGGTIYLWNWYVGPSPRLPGPKGLPIVGNVAKLPLFLTGKSHVVFKEYRAKYGKIFRVPGIFSSRPMVVVSEAAEVKRMLTETDTFARDDMFESKVSGLLDHALFVYPTSERWKRHRKLLQPAFGPSHLKHASIVSLNAMQELNAIWDQTFMKSKTFEVDIYTIFTCITLDIIAKVAFGESLGSVQSIGSDKCSRWEDLDAISIDVIPSRFFIPEFLWNYFGAGLKSPKVALARKNVHEYLHRLIVKGREDLKEMPEGFNMNVLHRLLLSNEKGLMSEEEIIGELLGFFLAGHETTSNTLTTTIYNLTKNPKALEKLYEEVHTVNLDEASILDTLPKLKYLDSVVRESQRLQSIVGNLGRTNTKTTTVMGYEFPKGTRFSLYIGAIHLSEEYYTDPLEFNPDRWTQPVVAGAFLPFGDGPHNCIGQKMALIETKVVLIEFVKRYNFQIVPGSNLEFVTSLTHGLKNGLPLILTKRG